MKKLISLLKATMSQDMSLFKYKAKSTSSKLNKVAFPIILTVIVMISVGSYAAMFAEELAPRNLTYVMLTLFILFTTIITIVEGIYKSQGILFDAKDNNLLFSLPIEKSKILFTRIFKLISFQFLYNSLFMIPAFAVYVAYERPGVSFYIISIVMLFLLPIIPTIISSFIGYIIKAISTKFKAKKIIQTILTIIVFLGIFMLSFNIQSIVKNLVQNAVGINDVITHIYYPAGLYINLINNFKIIDLIILLVLNIVPAMLFIYIASMSYFKIISKSSDKSSSKKQLTTNKEELKNQIQSNSCKYDEKKYKEKLPLKALIIKELKRYFSSPVYIFNTSFGVILMLVITIGISINLNGVISMASNGQTDELDVTQIINIMPQIFYQLIIFTACMTSITSSSISLEGKSFNLTKSLPISSRKILLSKIITSDIISIPLMLISDIIFIIGFKTDIINTVYILIITILMPNLIAIIGLFTNLKYPKMDATSDTEVVKQSASTMISVFIGMILGMGSIVLMIFACSRMNTNLFIGLELIIILVICMILYTILQRYGEKKIKEINV